MNVDLLFSFITFINVYRSVSQVVLLKFDILPNFPWVRDWRVVKHEIPSCRAWKLYQMKEPTVLLKSSRVHLAIILLCLDANSGDYSHPCGCRSVRSSETQPRWHWCSRRWISALARNHRNFKGGEISQNIVDFANLFFLRKQKASNKILSDSKSIALFSYCTLGH